MSFTPVTVILFPCHQLPMPVQDGVGGEDCGNFLQGLTS